MPGGHASDDGARDAGRRCAAGTRTRAVTSAVPRGSLSPVLTERPATSCTPLSSNGAVSPDSIVSLLSTSTPPVAAIDERGGAGDRRRLAAADELRGAGEQRQPDDRVERLQLLGQLAQVLLVGGARVAALDVAQRALARTHAALVRIEQRGAHVEAVGVARLARLDEVLARPRGEHLRGGDRHAELRRDVLGAQPVDLAGEQRRALAEREVGEVVDEPANGLLAPQHGVGVRALVPREQRLVAECLVAPARAADLVDRPVADEPVQPGPQLLRARRRRAARRARG